jgi:hypothetical protein
LAALLQAAFNGLLLLVNCEGCFIIRITWAREPLILATWHAHVLTMSCLTSTTTVTNGNWSTARHNSWCLTTISYPYSGYL